MVRFLVIASLALCTVLAFAKPAAPAPVAEFIGPFPSWANVKTEYGAVGDGKTDDTAAIQKALVDIRRAASPKKVLYFPAGTYRITDTIKLIRISHNEPLGMSVTGEDPLTTIIKWDGPAGGKMFLYDAWFASLSRLTFDGAGKAKTAVEHGPAFATANECTDCIFKDVQFGIEAGQKFGIAETAVLRCRFIRCATAGISIQNFNSLDWYIWDCWFEDCGIGATNEFGAGNFHVYQSTFLRSKDADITMRHCGYFSFANNVSIGSRRFFHAKRAGNWKETETWGAQGALQENLVLDPTDPTPLVIENNGPTLLLDNTIRMKGNGPVVVNTPPSEIADLIAVGNRWTAGTLQVKGRLTELDNTVVKAATIKDVKVTPVPFAARTDRPILEVPAGANAAVIQGAIDQAVAMKGKHPVVHLPKGNYTIEKTLVIPAGCDLLLIGDGPENATQLGNAGNVNPLIRVKGPTRATLRSFVVNAGNNNVGILVENADQPGARIYGEQLNSSGYEYGFVADGLKNAAVELRDQGHNGMQVVGAGPGTKPWTALFAGASSRHSFSKAGIHLYDVQNDGRLFVRDIWYEGEAVSLMNLTGSGEFAYHCGFVAPYTGFDESITKRLGEWEADLRKSVASLQFDGFRGKLSFTLVSANGAEIRVKPPSADLQLYLLGFMTNQKINLGGPEVKGQVVAEHVKVFRTNGTGLDSVDGVGKATPAFIRDMLIPLRTVKPQPLTDLKDGVTDVRFYRVWATGKNGVRVQAGAEQNNVLPY
ncbi:MAG: glycosyl hydrolase family 28-related protein [Armatimonadota bacterium]